jgi:putative DNA base modification enzyme with NMAD domain
MFRLFSYCILYDRGAAPNPFWEICTLAICKPDIRQHANVEDWVVGTGSAVSPIGNISDRVVYAMRVTQKMTMEDYDRFTRSKLPRKIPLMTSTDPRRRSGDSIYDFSASPPSLRPSMHGEGCRRIDLKGYWVLLSNHFFYFGGKPVALPEELLEIVKKGPGYKVRFDPQFVDDFIHWIYNLGYPPAALIGKPQLEIAAESPSSVCGPRNRREDETDLAEPDSPRSHPC